MKKKLLVSALTLSFVMTMTSAVSFANALDVTPIKNVEQLKNAIEKDFSDGSFSKKEKQEILALTETETVNELLTEKISVAADIINQQVIELNGSNLSTYSYDLGDNCELTIKLQDRAETDGLYTSIMPMATSGSEELWKNYGDRYFTAVASVKCNVATASFRLENHYTLSSAGIDERPGKAFATWTLGDGLLAVDNPVITDSSARTVGASDVNMHCIFTCKSGSAGPDKYKVNTTVKYISHDKTGKRIKVGQVWNLTKVS